LPVWKASGGVCNIVIVLEDCTIGGSTSAIGTMAELERAVRRGDAIVTRGKDGETLSAKDADDSL